jgi:hypothetical protein
MSPAAGAALTNATPATIVVRSQSRRASSVDAFIGDNDFKDTTLGEDDFS